VKFLAFILSIYILALNFTPCEDGVIEDNEFNIEISQFGEINEGNADIDNCSPFCQCQCCHIHTTTYNETDYTIAPIKISTEIILHFDSLGYDFHNPIFEPPKYA